MMDKYHGFMHGTNAEVFSVAAHLVVNGRRVLGDLSVAEASARPRLHGTLSPRYVKKPFVQVVLEKYPINKKSPIIRAFFYFILEELPNGYSLEINYCQSLAYTVKVLGNSLCVILNKGLA